MTNVETFNKLMKFIELKQLQDECILDNIQAFADFYNYDAEEICYELSEIDYFQHYAENNLKKFKFSKNKDEHSNVWGF